MCKKNNHSNLQKKVQVITNTCVRGTITLYKNVQVITNGGEVVLVALYGDPEGPWPVW